MSEVVKYFGVSIIGFVFVVGDFFTKFEAYSVIFSGSLLIVLSFDNWRNYIVDSIYSVIYYIKDKYKEYRSPVVLDDWYLPWFDD